MQMALINNYSTMSEERHKKILDILSNTDTNRNALVPVVSNLPRTTSTLTNSTASSTSDVSCRSNPDIPSECANTNISSDISSIFYGAVRHVSTLNVFTNPHSWALECFTALVNTFPWISSVCWNKWIIFLFSLLYLIYWENLLESSLCTRWFHMFTICALLWASYTHNDVCDIN